MRLQTAKHRVVRVFHAVLTLVMFGLIGIVSWNFAIRPNWSNIPETIKAIDLPNTLSASTEGLTFQHTEGDRTFYTLRAKKHQTFNDGPNLFQGVEVTIYGNETDPERHIAADECTYDPKTGDIEFRGNVVALLDENTTGRTTALIYRNQGRLAVARSRVTVERPGEMTAAANTMEFGIESGLLKLGGNVHATLASGAELDANSAVFHQHESWATVTGNVSVRSMTGWARGDNARAELEPGTFRPMSITLRGNVTAETRSRENSDVWELKCADKLDLFMNPTGAVERVAAIGQAWLEKRAESGRRMLTGGELLAWVNPRGDVERVEATEAAVLEAGDGDRVTRLASGKIRIDPSGVIVTEGPSKMDSGDSTITGRDFRVEQGDISTFATSFPASVDSRRPGAPTRNMKAEQSTTARIDGKTNKLISMVSIGTVRFIDGDRRGNADKATVTDGGDTIVLEGSARVIDPKTTVDGHWIEIRERGAKFAAKGAVKTVSQSESGPVTVTANEARGGSGGVTERVFYKGNVKGSIKTASGPLTISASEAEGDSTAMTYKGRADAKVDTVVTTETGPVRIVALEAVGNADTMKYTGAVELWRDHDSVHIQSEILWVWSKEKRFKAEGNVRSTMQELGGTSATLEYAEAKGTEYDDGQGTARYSGNVKLVQKDMTLDASQVDVTLVKGRISGMVAAGAVTATRAGSRGTGNRAVYDAKTDKVTLTGQPARVTDPVRGNSEGPTVTMERSTGNASITGSGENTPQGRVKSIINVPR